MPEEQELAMASQVASDIIDREPALGEIVRRLVDAYSPLRIYLFGSKARGEDGPDSDYDLMVVVPDDAPTELRQSRFAYEALHDIDAPADVSVCTETYFQSRQHLKASFPATVAREGKLLYGA
jgi:predicted nucleotidyltransferase